MCRHFQHIVEIFELNFRGSTGFEIPCAHPRAVFAGVVFQQRPEDLYAHVSWQQYVENFGFVGLVVIHDRTVDRTTDGRGRVDSMTIRELKALDAGYRWEDAQGRYPHRNRGVRIPLLEDVLSEFDHQRLLIEIKPNSAQVAQQLCATLERFEMDEKTVVASFHGDALSAFRQACPQTPVSATSGQVLLYTLLHLVRLDAAYLNPPIAFQVPERAGPLNLVDERFVKSVHARDAYVHVWTVNRTEAMRRLLDLGVDGIMTDYPDRLISLVNNSQIESNP